MQTLKGQISDLENAADSKHIHTRALTSWVASHNEDNINLTKPLH